MIEPNRIICGCCLEELKKFPDEHIDCCITSPPYWGLRAYGTNPQIWDGDPGCEHNWGNDIRNTKENHQGQGESTLRGGNVSANEQWNKGVNVKKPHSNFCLKCSAWRGELGLEPDFHLYIDHLIQIFAEVKRALKPTGTCWVNIGDSYAGSGSPGGDFRDGKGGDDYLRPYNRTGLPAKSLVGIPERFALAMTDERGFIIKKEADRSWLAGIIEGEGCIHIHKRDKDRKNATYTPFLSIHNTNERMISRVCELTKQSENVQSVFKQGNHRLYRWNGLANNARSVLREVYPYLITKRDQARCALYCPTSGLEAEECWINIKRMHHYESPTREYPEPKVGGENPWIRRNTIIWHKRNAMPSSASDRFTVDFEYVYFFVKNKKYWFEQQIEMNSPTSVMGGKFAAEKKTDYVGNGHSGLKVENNTWQGRNMRCVWDITTRGYKEAHFAVFPEKLIEPMIKAGCPPKGIVLDPFMGSGTTAVVAKKLGRHWIGIELNPEYIRMAEERIKQTAIEGKLWE